MSVQARRSPTKGLLYGDDPRTARHFGMNSIKFPRGTQEVPARTCAQLAAHFPNFPDGYYWLDPNGGRTSDAVKVYCRIKTKESCVAPKRSFAVDAWDEAPKDRSTWFQNFNKAGEFDYAIDADQLAFLKVFSSRASQSLKISCRGLAENVTSPELLADDDTILSMTHPKRRFSLASNECGRVETGETVVRVDSKPSRLPLRDVKLAAGVPMFGVDVGEVCFS